MKTFIFSIPARLRSFNEKLDVKGALCGKSWEVFNDEGVKQLFIFNTDGTLLITLNGKVMRSKWEYISANSSVLITTENETIMFHPAFYDKLVFALQQDGVERYLFMIDEQQKSVFPEITLQALEMYFEEKERKALEADPVYIAEQQREWDRIEKEEIERQRELEMLWKEEERDDLYNFMLDYKYSLLEGCRMKQRRWRVVSVVLCVLSLISLFLVASSSLYGIGDGLKAFLLTMGIVFLISSIPGFSGIPNKIDFVRRRFEEETGTSIKYLDEEDIQQLYEKL